MFWRHACNADRCAGSERSDTASKKRALITGIHALRFQVVQGVRMILELVGAPAFIRDGHAGQVPSTFFLISHGSPFPIWMSQLAFDDMESSDVPVHVCAASLMG